MTIKAHFASTFKLVPIFRAFDFYTLLLTLAYRFSNSSIFRSSGTSTEERFPFAKTHQQYVQQSNISLCKYCHIVVLLNTVCCNCLNKQQQFNLICCCFLCSVFICSPEACVTMRWGREGSHAFAKQTTSVHDFRNVYPLFTHVERGLHCMRKAVKQPLKAWFLLLDWNCLRYCIFASLFCTYLNFHFSLIASDANTNQSLYL